MKNARNTNFFTNVASNYYLLVNDKVILVVGLDENGILVTITVRVIFYI